METLRAALVADAIDQRSLGIGTYLRGLVPRLARLPGLELTLVHLSESRDPFYHDAEELVVPRWPHPPRIPLRNILRLPQALRVFDLVHFPDFHLFPLRVPVPAVETLHDLIPLIMPDGVDTNFLYPPLLRRNLTHASRIICVSKTTRRDLKRLLPQVRAPCRVVHEAPDPRFGPAVPERVVKDFKLKAPFILAVGSVEPRKNFGLLLDALSILRKRGRSVNLVVAGRPGWRGEEFTARMRALRLGGRVSLLGDFPYERLPELYSAAAVFCFPSLYEGFGLPPLEAMACGTPALVSDRGSLPEVVGDGGTLLPAYDPMPWADAVGRLLDDGGERDEAARRGSAWVKRYSLDREAAETLAVYRDAVGTGGG